MTVTVTLLQKPPRCCCGSGSGQRGLERVCHDDCKQPPRDRLHGSCHACLDRGSGINVKWSSWASRFGITKRDIWHGIAVGSRPVDHESRVSNDRSSSKNDDAPPTFVGLLRLVGRPSRAYSIVNVQVRRHSAEIQRRVSRHWEHGLGIEPRAGLEPAWRHDNLEGVVSSHEVAGLLRLFDDHDGHQRTIERTDDSETFHRAFDIFPVGDEKTATEYVEISLNRERK